MSTFRQRKQERIAAQKSPQAVGVDIFNCQIAGMSVWGIQEPSDEIRPSARCVVAETPITINPGEGICQNFACEHHERR